MKSIGHFPIRRRTSLEAESRRRTSGREHAAALPVATVCRSPPCGRRRPIRPDPLRSNGAALFVQYGSFLRCCHESITLRLRLPQSTIRHLGGVELGFVYSLPGQSFLVLFGRLKLHSSPHIASFPHYIQARIRSIAMQKLTEKTQSKDIELKIEGHSLTILMDCSEFISSGRWSVAGHDWEIRLRPRDTWYSITQPVTLQLVLHRKASSSNGNVKARLSCCLVDPTQKLKPSEKKTVLHKFHNPSDCSNSAVLMTREELEASGYLMDDSYIVQCAITVLRQQPEIAAAAVLTAGDLPNAVAPPSELHAHLGALLQSKTGADVTFVVSGESFAAHMAILASRSPVFMAELYGFMKEKASQRVEIKDMEAPVFKAILHFVYTNTVPELDHHEEVTTAMAQHLLAGADRYGLERLKLICESKLAECIDVDTVSTTLALAEQHNCSRLKAKCVEFIAGGTLENLYAVLSTHGYKHLEASCPSVLTELLKVARGRKN